ATLRFTTDAADALWEAEVVWIAWDTPVDDDDAADVEAVMARADKLFPKLRPDAIVIVSSQLPVGTVERLEARCCRARSAGDVTFVSSPENLRLGKAIDAFCAPERVVVGARGAGPRARVTELFAPFTDRIEWMSVESAEMTKHALNAFLAASIAFINE